VRGVACQEDTSVGEAFREVGLGMPRRDVLDDNRHPWNADRGAQQLQGTLLGNPFRDVGPGG